MVEFVELVIIFPVFDHHSKAAILGIGWWIFLTVSKSRISKDSMISLDSRIIVDSRILMGSRSVKEFIVVYRLISECIGV